MKYFLLYFIFIFSIFQGSFGQNKDPLFINGEIFVKVKQSSNVELPEFTNEISVNMPDNLEPVLTQYEVTAIKKTFHLPSETLQKIYTFSFSDTSVTENLIRNLEALTYIEYAERIPVFKTSLTPDDIQSNQWYLNKVNAEEAWDISTGNSNIVVAIVDNAVSTNHPDLSANAWVNPGEMPGNNIDDDGNGYIDDINGYDVIDGDPDPNPPSSQSSWSHGTHCAGLAAGMTNNGTGIASISWNVNYMGIKCTPDASPPFLYNTHIGVQYAIDNGADIISMSFGSSYYSQTYQNIFNYAYSQGVVCIAAAGNDDSYIPKYPAAYDHVISVGATNSDDQKAWFSNYGTWIDVMAPGKDMYSTLHPSSYGNKSGTSMACPLTSGLAALMLSYDPTLTPDELESCLKSSCDNIDAQNPSYTGQIGAGRINAEAALLCLEAVAADFTVDYDHICPGVTVNFTDQSSGNPAPNSWQWFFPGGTPSSSTQQNPSVTYSTAGTYDVTLIVSNGSPSDTITKTAYITVDSPSAVISGNATITQGNSTDLRIDLEGRPPWTIVYTDGSSSYTVNGISSSPYYITVSPTVTTSYTLAGISDADCSGRVSGSALINVITCNASSAPDFYTKTMGGPDEEEIYTHTLTSDGGFIAAGYSGSFGSGSNDVLVVKYNACGEKEWAKVYDESGKDEESISIKQTADMGFLITHRSWDISGSTSSLDIVVIKTDPLGNILWTKEYGTSGADYPRILINTTDNGFAIGGVTNYAGGNEFLIIKADSLGNIQWTKNYGVNSANIEFLSHLIQTSDSGYLATGLNSPTSGLALVAIKIDKNGTVEWQKVYASSNESESGFGIIELSNGDFLFSGKSLNTGSGMNEALLMRTDNQGNIIWSNVYGGTSDELANAVSEDQNGNIFFSGATNSFGPGDDDLYISKSDALGNIIWTKLYGGNNDDGLYYGSTTGQNLSLKNNILYSTGSTQSFGAGMNDVYFIKTSTDDDTTCTKGSATFSQNSVSLIVSNPNFTTKTPPFSVSSPSLTTSTANPSDSVICESISTDCAGDNTVFSAIYDGGGNDEAHSIIQTSDNGYLIGGTTTSNTAGGNDLFLLKTDIYGNKVWQKTYGGTGNDYGNSVSIIQLSDGSFILTGTTSSFGSSDGNAYILKLNQIGDIIWEKSFGGNGGNEHFRSVMETSDGNLLLCGTQNSFSAGSADGFVLKMDTSGALIWITSTGGGNADHLTGIVEADNGDYLIAGGYRSFGSGSNSAYLLRLDQNGSKVWEKVYDLSSTDAFINISKTTDGGYILSGQTNSAGAGGRDIWCVKINDSGNIDWTKAYGGTADERVMQIKETPDNGFIITGHTQSFGGDNEILLMKTDASGNVEWSKTYGDTGDDYLDNWGDGFLLANDGGFIFAGYSNSFSSTDDILLIKTDACGNAACFEAEVSVNEVMVNPTVSNITATVNTGGSFSNTSATVMSDVLSDSVLCSTINCSILVVNGDFAQKSDSPCQPVGFSSDINLDCVKPTDGNISIHIDSNGTGWNGGYWTGIYDHTPGGGTYLLFGDGPTSTQRVWYQTINVEAGETYEFSAWFMNANVNGVFSGATSSFELRVGGLTGTLITQTGALSQTADWTQYGGSYTASTSGPVEIDIIILGGSFSGNDFAIDDILFKKKGCEDNSSDSCLVSANFTYYPDTALCENYVDSITFTNTSVITGNATYQWTFSGGATPSSSTQQDPPPVYYPGPGVYDVTLVVTDDSCGTDSITQQVVIYTPPPQPDAGNDTAICYLGDSVQIGAPPVSGWEYSWSPAYGLSDSTLAEPMARPDTTTTYILKATSTTTGCEAFDTITINIIPVSFFNDPFICTGDSVQLLTFGLDSAIWSPSYGLNDSSDLNPIASPDTTTTYRAVGYSDICGTDTAFVTVTVTQLLSVDAGEDMTIAQGDEVQLNACCGDSYQWEPDTWLSDPDIANPVATPAQEITYYVTIRDESGCSATDSIHIFIEQNFYIPNMFSPNGDGNNDQFKVYGEGFDHLRFRIYNRWGQLLYEAVSIEDIMNGGWDGKYNDKEQPEGTYIWQIEGEFLDGTPVTYKGKAAGTFLLTK